jgi:hypothetical protein
MLRRTMARKKQTGAAAPKAAVKTAAPTIEPVTVRSVRRDLRPLIYGVLDVLFAVVYFYVLVAVIPNRLMSALVHLYALPVCMLGMGAGMAIRIVLPAERARVGWWIAVVSGSLMILSTILLIIRVLVSAAFLAGVYGAFGKAAATSALIGVALVIEVVALVPLFQVKYLMTRAGRRAFAMER